MLLGRVHVVGKVCENASSITQLRQPETSSIQQADSGIMQSDTHPGC